LPDQLANGLAQLGEADVSPGAPEYHL
jgi:hypothetical protein